MRRHVIVAPEAARHIELIDSWWRENRPASPHLFAEELAAALSTLEAAPEAGTRYAHPQLRGVRRLLLRSTRHHVYYTTGADAVVVLAVWGAVRGAGPDLKLTPTR